MKNTERMFLTRGFIRSRWQRFRLWRAYRRPVTFYDLRKILHDAQYPSGEITAAPIDPNAEAAFMACIRRAEHMKSKG